MGEIAIRMSGCSQPFVDLDSANPRCARLFHRLRSVPMCRSYICRYLRNQPFKCDSAPEAAPFVQSKHEARSLGINEGDYSIKRRSILRRPAASCRW